MSWVCRTSSACGRYDTVVEKCPYLVTAAKGVEDEDEGEKWSVSLVLGAVGAPTCCISPIEAASLAEVGESVGISEIAVGNPAAPFTSADFP